MIKSFRSKALEQFWTTGSGRKLPVENHSRVSRQLQALNAATEPRGVDLPGYKFHGLHTDPQRWAIWVTGNYRITFAWDGVDAQEVDMEDYH